MLLRRLLHSSRHLRQGVQTLTTATTVIASATAGSSSALPSRRFPNLLPFRHLSPRLLSSSGRDDDTNKPWDFTPESGDPDPFADVDAGAAAGGAPLGSGAAVEDTWTKGFGEEDDVLEEISKEEAVSAPVARKAAAASDDEQWTLSGDDEKDDPLAQAISEEGMEGIVGVPGELDAAGEEEAELQRQQRKKREQELMEILKGPKRAFGDLITESGITDDMIDSLILLKDVRHIPGLPSLSKLDDSATQKSSETSRADIERQKQEEIAKARVRQVDEKGRAYGTGKRKCSIARVWIQPGDGKFIVNDKQFDAYFPILDHRADLLGPFTVTKTLGLWDVNCTVKGGGVSGQVGAIRLGISRALQNWEPGLRPYLKPAGYLTRDSRIVERKKPGKAKARKSFQWVKR